MYDSCDKSYKFWENTPKKQNNSTQIKDAQAKGEITDWF